MASVISGDANVSAAEFGYLDGVTSGLQSQIDAKLASSAYQPGLVLITSESFSAVSSVSVDNCFSATYQNYRIIMVGTSSTGMGSDIRLRASGTDSTGSHYVQQLINVSSSSVTAAGQTGTSFAAAIISNGNAMMMDALVFRPHEAVTTQVNVLSSRENYLAWTSGYHTQTTSYDGFSLIAAAGQTFSGIVRIYGLRN